MDKIMKSWVGMPITSVIEHWGYPTSEKTILGRKLYTWFEVNYYTLEYSVYEGSCSRIFEVNDNNEVIKWEWKGSNCPAAKCTGKKWVNPNNNPWDKK